VTDDPAKRAWLTGLFDEHGSALEGYLYRRLGNHADACELTQETYLRMWQIEDITKILEPKSYMFTIARHLADNRLTEHGRARGCVDPEDPVVQEELSDHRDLGAELADAETLAKIRKAFDELPPKVRAAWHLKVGHGLTYEQIAQHLGVTTHTVKKYLQQVIRHCQRRVVGEKDEDE
jgi:RNA polymerase sigma-70 factor (ECF subfamily)